jgi:hypothetical protein
MEAMQSSKSDRSIYGSNLFRARHYKADTYDAARLRMCTASHEQGDPMNVIDKDLLKSLRLPGLCAICRKPCKMRCGHHVRTKGECQVDHMFNLVQLGMNPRDCLCHHNFHAMGRPSRQDFLRAVSTREGVPLEFIVEVMNAVIKCPPRMLSHEAATAWLVKAFPEDVALKAAEIVKPMFKE